MESHVRNVGWMLVWMGAAFGVVSLIVLAAFGGYDGLLMTDDPFYKRKDIASIPLDRLLSAFLLTYSMLMSAPMVLVGRGILSWKPWSRVAGMLVSAVNLLHFPIGTATGIYALWVLHDDASHFIFDHPPGTPRR